MQARLSYWCGNVFFALFCTEKRNVCQDRLGINVGKVDQAGVFSQAVRDAKARAAREKASMVAKWKREPLDLEQFNGTSCAFAFRVSCVCVGGAFLRVLDRQKRKKREKREFSRLPRRA